MEDMVVGDIPVIMAIMDIMAIGDEVGVTAGGGEVDGMEVIVDTTHTTMTATIQALIIILLLAIITLLVPIIIILILIITLQMAHIIMTPIENLLLGF